MNLFSGGQTVKDVEIICGLFFPWELSPSQPLVLFLCCYFTASIDFKEKGEFIFGASSVSPYDLILS